MIPTDETLVTGYKGVTEFGNGKFFARPYICGKQRLIGPFDTAVEAAECWDFALDYFYKTFRRKPSDAKFNAGTRNTAAYIKPVYRDLCEELEATIRRAQFAGESLPEYAESEWNAHRQEKQKATAAILAEVNARLARIEKALSCHTTS